MKTITIQARYQVRLKPEYLSLLDRTADPVRIRGTKYCRYTIRGVPGRKADVIIAEAIEQHRVDKHAVLEISDQRPQALAPEHEKCVLEIGTKLGKYDNANRRRYALRYFRAKDMVDIPHADLKIISHDDELLIIVLPADGSAALVDTYQTLPMAPSPKDLDFDHDFSKIIGWHWRKWFTHLTEGAGSNREDRKSYMRHFCDGWEAEIIATGQWQHWTQVEMHRAASRALYRLSRELGWRKLTKKEKIYLGIPDANQWQHESFLAPILASRSVNGLNSIGISDDPELEEEANEYELIEMEFHRKLPYLQRSTLRRKFP